MRNAFCRAWKIERKLKNLENEICTLQDLEYGKKHLKNMENAERSVGPGIWQEN